MYISKNKSLSWHLKNKTKEEFINELKKDGHTYAVLESEQGRSVTVFYVPTDLTPRADFVSAKEAISVFTPLEVEPKTLKKMNSMCEESLDPDTFEKWEQVKEAIISTRKAFKAIRLSDY